MKLAKFSLISDFNIGDSFISESIDFLSQKIFSTKIANYDIYFQKFDIEERIKRNAVDASFEKNKRGALKSWFINQVKLLLFYNTDLRRCEAVIEDCDAVILGGGNLLFEYNGSDLFYRCWKIVDLAKKHNKKVFIYAVGVGPFQFPYKKKLKEIVEFSDCVCVRDKASQLLCNAVVSPQLVSKTRVTFDPAFILSDVHCPSLLSSKYLGVNLMNFRNVVKGSAFDINLVVSNLLALSSSMKLGVKIVNTAYGEDYNMSLILKKRLELAGCSVVRLCNVRRTQDLPEIFSDMAVFLACRMHSSIFALSYLTPVVIFPWQPKIRALYTEIFSEQENNLLAEENFTPSDVLRALKVYGNRDLPSLVSDIKKRIYSDFFGVFKDLVQTTEGEVLS